MYEVARAAGALARALPAVRGRQARGVAAQAQAWAWAWAWRWACAPPADGAAGAAGALRGLRTAAGDARRQLPPGPRDPGGAGAGAGAGTGRGGKLLIAFTCRRCGARSSRLISRAAYERGVVIVGCAGCGRRHLIADRLGWFPQHARGRPGRADVESFLAARGERVRRGGDPPDGDGDGDPRTK